MEDKLNKILEEVININSRFDNLENRFDNLENRFDNLENRFDNLENRFDNLENKFDNLENRFDNLENRFDNLENRFDNLESQTKENTEMLKSLLHSAEVNRAEHDKMMIGIAHLEGEVTSIKRDLSTVEVVTANNYAELAKLKTAK